MMRRLLLFALCGATLCAQTIINGSRTILGIWDASGAAATLPAKTGTTLPETCTPGELFFKTNATAGQNLYGCVATDTWMLLGDGGTGGGGLSDPGANGIVVRTALNTTTARTITGTANRVTVNNGDGVSGNPTLDIGSDVVTGASSHALTNKTLDVEGTGNTITTVHYQTWLAANCQGTAAALGFASRTTNTPTAACVTGTNTNYGVAQFLDTEIQRVQGRFPLPPDWTGDINFSLRWSAAATANNVVWQIQTACVADGETGDPAWNTAQTITDAAKGTANQFNDASLGSALTVTGCAAGEEMFFRFLRDPDHASDTLAATASLHWIRFQLRRAQ